MEEKELMASVYNPKEVEDKWYTFWEENKYFSAKVDKEKKPFCIVMPPPNVTGQLHMGHALDNTMQDILTRFRRMQGYSVLWLPGTDHAGIATQAKVEEQLRKEGISKYDLGREKFLQRAWQWKEQYGGRITHQLRKIGSSCDWDRERFTMDEGCSEAVLEVFVNLYEKRLIYRGNYITNWCPCCHTTISDIEVEHQEKPGHFYHLKYPFADGSGYVIVATTRPETMLGDTAVAVHPEDERYKDLIGKMLILPITNRQIPLIADEYVDAEFGTGAVKITPAHDPNDFEVGQRHNLEQIVVMDKDAKMNDKAGEFQGLDRFECRHRLVKKLKEDGFLVKVEDHNHAVGHCYRCSTVIEPMVSKQWFVKMAPLAKPAIEAAKDGRIEFIPSRFTKIYLGWMENIRDWCISRQLWWGHRIPVWYCDCGEVIVSKTAPTKCNACGGTNLKQDSDVLDTWFSSGLWPFSTLGWPENTPELDYFYPTSVLVTGRDIIFFWVARMIFSGLYNMKEVPFKQVFIHGLVLDAMGRKMSKSLGNGVDPIEVIESHGADSLRFMLITGNTPGNDLRFHFERLDGARNFANKIWNASRFTLMNLKDYEVSEDYCPSLEDLSLADLWVKARLKTIALEVTKNLESYELGEAARILYEFIWNEFCDWYIEMAKPRLYGDNLKDKKVVQYVLSSTLRGALELLHPFMPFITEEIWQRLPHKGETIMKAFWPSKESQIEDEEKDALNKIDWLMEMVRGIRHIRSEMNVPLGKKAKALLVVAKKAYPNLEKLKGYLESLASVEVSLYWDLPEIPEQAAHAVAKDVEIYLPLKGLIDLDKEILRLKKELANLEKDLTKISGKLANKGFLEKAKPEVVSKEKEKEAELSTKKKAVLDRLLMFSSMEG